MSASGLFAEWRIYLIFQVSCLFRQCPSEPWSSCRALPLHFHFGNCCDIWNILFMAPRIKMVVILNLLWSVFVETNELIYFDKLAPK